MKKERVVVIDVVGLSLAHFDHREKMPHLSSLLDNGHLAKMRPVFPALTLPAQASLTTGTYPETHGVVANGFYFPEQFQIAFWEQHAHLVQAERIWERLKKGAPQHKTAALFFQNMLYAQCDAIITPKPLHTEKGLVQWCYSKPSGLYESICTAIGDFNLLHFWGPLASIESSQWIAKAALEVIDRIRPNLLFVYLPHLDYSSQIHGPESPFIIEELALIDHEVGRIVNGIKDRKLANETVFMVLSEYQFHRVKKDIPINRHLRENGLLKVRTIDGREYLDVELSPAVAMVDHQIAHIYVKPEFEEKVWSTLEKVEGIDMLLDEEGKAGCRVNHPRSGSFIAISARDRWFSYYWWEDRAKEPHFAPHVDIHRKPGYDPLELFIEPGTFTVPQDTTLIKGSHGYPALSEQDDLPFLISGEGVQGFELREDLCITDVAAFIESVLSGN